MSKVTASRSLQESSILPKTQLASRAGLEGVVESLLTTQHLLEMFRRSLPDGPPRRCLARVSNRLTKILAIARKLGTQE